MISKQEIIKGRRKEKIPIKQPLVGIISGTIKREGLDKNIIKDIKKQRKLNINYVQKRIESASFGFEILKGDIYHQIGSPFPFSLANREDYDLANDVIKEINNPYINYISNSCDELKNVNTLFKLNPNIEEGKLKTFNFRDLVQYELSKKGIKNIKKQIKEVKDEIKRVENVSMSSRSPFYLKEISDKLNFENVLKEDISINLNPRKRNDYLDNLIEKIKVDHVKEYISAQGSSIKDIKKSVMHSSVKESISKRLFILESKELKLIDYFDNLDDQLSKKIDAISEEIFKDNNTSKMDISDLKRYIGDNAKIYPKGNPEGEYYDLGGDISTLPAGSKGIIKEVSKPDNDEFYATIYLNMDKEMNHRSHKNKWAVSPRELKLKTGKEIISERYNISEGLTEAILTKDYKSIINYGKQDILEVKLEKLSKLTKEKDILDTFIKKVEYELKNYAKIN